MGLPQISIHTSAKEVTQHFIKSRACQTYFNPHFREGSDLLEMVKEQVPMDFNPHFREGSDKEQVPMGIYALISIHTSAKEVTEPHLKHSS